MQKEMIKCLLVDDDADDQGFFKLAVEALTIKVELSIAGNGEEAFEVLNQDSTLPDCVFLDLNMPKMNGREFLKKIKMTHRLMDIPVIIYSTSTSAKDKTDMLLLGAQNFIIKPNSVNELITVLRSEMAKVQASV